MYHLNEDGQWSDKGTGFVLARMDAFGKLRYVSIRGSRSI